MPIMIRSKFAEKILFKVLGKPSAFEDKTTSKKRKINKLIAAQDTRLSR